MPAEPDPLAIELVAVDGHQLALKGQERLEAIRIMVAQNVPREQMAWRLCMKISALERCAGRANILLPKTKPSAHWTLEYYEQRLADKEAYNERRREAVRKRREAQNTN